MLWTLSIRDKADTKAYGYLTYDWDKDEYHATFNKELPTGAPVMFRILAERGQFYMDDKLCRVFIRDRVIPANRQNIGEILREMGERFYHECFMLKHIPLSVMDDAYIELKSVQ